MSCGQAPTTWASPLLMQAWSFCGGHLAFGETRYEVHFWRGVPPPCLTNAGNTLSPSVPTSSFQLQAECVEHASQLAAQCGYLPLALDMLGAVVRSSALGPVREFER